MKSVSNTVRAALKQAERTQVELQKHLGLSSPSAMGNKFLRGSWSAVDLVNVATFTEGELIIRYSDGTEIPVKIEEQ